MKTEAEIQELIERRAKLYAANIHSEYIPEYTARDFLAGATLGREIEREQVRALIEAACAALDRPASMTFLVLLKEIKKYQAARGDDHE